MRVLLSTYGSWGDAEPIVALAAQLSTLGAKVRPVSRPSGAIRIEGGSVATRDRGW